MTTSRRMVIQSGRLDRKYDMRTPADRDGAAAESTAAQGDEAEELISGMGRESRPFS